jgi:Zn-dependent protease with chaperone function
VNAPIEAWWTWIASVALQATVLAVIVCAIDRASARWLPASVRGWFHAVVLLRLLLPADLRSPIGLGQLGFDVAIPATTGASHAAWFWAWLGSVTLLAALIARDYGRRARRQRRGERPLDAEWRAAALQAAQQLGRKRPPTTRFVAGDHSPCATGLVRGRVLVPREFAAGVAPDERALVLLHEYAHVQRRDPLRALAVVTVQVLFWFHPIVWLAA